MKLSSEFFYGIVNSSMATCSRCWCKVVRKALKERSSRDGLEEALIQSKEKHDVAQILKK